MNKKLSEMTPQEEQEYISEINDYFCSFIEAAPFVEVGDVPGMQVMKLKTNGVDEGQYSVGAIIFELQWMLHIQKKRHPEVHRMIVSELMLTPELHADGFHPRRGIMAKVKYL